MRFCGLSLWRKSEQILGYSKPFVVCFGVFRIERLTLSVSVLSKKFELFVLGFSVILISIHMKDTKLETLFDHDTDDIYAVFRLWIYQEIVVQERQQSPDNDDIMHFCG